MDLLDAHNVGALTCYRLAHAAAPVIVPHVRVAIRLLPKVWVPGDQLVAVGAEAHRRPVTADAAWDCAGNLVEACMAVLIAVRSTRVAGVVRGAAAADIVVTSHAAVRAAGIPVLGAALVFLEEEARVVYAVLYEST